MTTHLAMMVLQLIDQWDLTLSMDPIIMTRELIVQLFFITLVLISFQPYLLYTRYIFRAKKIL